MSFTSPVFLFLFFPLSLLLYQFIPNKLKSVFIIVLSLFFYTWGSSAFLPLILASILFNYFLGRLLFLLPKYSSPLLITGLVINLGVLAYFKYLSPTLPLGISFYTFHCLSYLFDVNSRAVSPASPLKLGVYLLFFPHLSAGPITPFRTFSPETTALPSLNNALPRIITGLAQKTLLANQFALLANTAFVTSNPSLDLAWLGLIAYTLQIYFDFNGYSNLALGIAELFGYKLSENFNYPYLARSISDFWSRWHISLTSFLRQYLYFPLGGSRRGEGRTILNILIVFAVSGLWHGTGWTFLVWGLWHGVLMSLERLTHYEALPLPLFLKRALTMILVMVGWVFFRAENLRSAFSYLHSLFNYSSLSLPTAPTLLTPATILLLLLGSLASIGLFARVPKYVYPFLFLLSLASIGSSTFNSFIYTKF